MKFSIYLNRRVFVMFPYVDNKDSDQTARMRRLLGFRWAQMSDGTFSDVAVQYFRSFFLISYPYRLRAYFAFTYSMLVMG